MEDHREYMKRFKKQLEDYRDQLIINAQDHLLSYCSDELGQARFEIKQIEAVETLLEGIVLSQSRETN